MRTQIYASHLCHLRYVRIRNQIKSTSRFTIRSLSKLKMVTENMSKKTISRVLKGKTDLTKASSKKGCTPKKQAKKITVHVRVTGQKVTKKKNIVKKDVKQQEQKKKVVRVNVVKASEVTKDVVVKKRRRQPVTPPTPVRRPPKQPLTPLPPFPKTSKKTGGQNSKAQKKATILFGKSIK
jgi:hypothetical protein